MAEQVEPHLWALNEKSPRYCLVCRKPMKLALLSAIHEYFDDSLVGELARSGAFDASVPPTDSHRVIVDECRDHGIWFDKHELQKALHAATTESQGS
jgi:hypothetical protein